MQRTTKFMTLTQPYLITAANLLLYNIKSKHHMDGLCIIFLYRPLQLFIKIIRIDRIINELYLLPETFFFRLARMNYPEKPDCPARAAASRIGAK